jgi:hypothetical protein
MEQKEVETLVGDLEDWMFEVARLVRRGYGPVTRSGIVLPEPTSHTR